MIQRLIQRSTVIFHICSWMYNRQVSSAINYQVISIRALKKGYQEATTFVNVTQKLSFHLKSTP